MDQNSGNQFSESEFKGFDGYEVFLDLKGINEDICTWFALIGVLIMNKVLFMRAGNCTASYIALLLGADATCWSESNGELVSRSISHPNFKVFCPTHCNFKPKLNDRSHQVLGFKGPKTVTNTSVLYIKNDWHLYHHGIQIRYWQCHFVSSILAAAASYAYICIYTISANEHPSMAVTRKAKNVSKYLDVCSELH